MIALDTNILLYSCDKGDARRQARALEIIAASTDGVLLWQVACEFVAASRKLVHVGFTPDQAWARLAEFLDVLPTSGTLDRARRLQLESGWSFWDALIVAACLEHGVARLYSEDLPGRDLGADLQIVNPFA
jgi:predicted nucleic acid-binding protein